MILLDTHVLVWLDQGNEQLGTKARTEIDLALKNNTLAISAISFWELGMLRAKNRIELPQLFPWRRELIEMGLLEIPLDGVISIRANDLIDFHPDPADRLIVATALEAGATLITADQRILAWSGELPRMDAGK